MADFTIKSWNVNGLRSCAGRGFGDWLQACGADVVCVQEVRALPAQLPAAVREPDGWHAAFAAAERPGYSGVGLYSRRPPDELVVGLGDPRFDCEGRLIRARFGRLWVAAGYFPNGNGTPLPGGKRSNDRIPYKLDFYRALFDQLEPLRAAGAPLVVLGDWNTAPAEADLARPKENRETSGFRPEERAEVARWLQAGWTDTFRHLHPAATGAYSWWSQRFGVRQKNIGWRIDLALCSAAVVPALRAATVDSHVTGSDHCPIGVVVEAGLLGGG